VIVRLNASGQYLRTERQGTPYLLYDSMRLFYDNGGGICYVVSVDNFTVAPAIGNDTTGILGGLKTLEKYDEPTLLVCPDATSLNTDLYTFQQQAINQCNKLQDRFTICDLLKNNEFTAGQTFDDRVAEFRDNIGINFLKYAAAYAPWLRTSLPAGLRFRDIIFALDGDPAPTAASSLALLTSLTTSPALLQLMFDLSEAVKAVDLVKSKLLPGGPASLLDADVADLDGQVKKLLKKYKDDYTNVALTTFAQLSPNLIPIYTKIWDILHQIRLIYESLPTVVTAILTPTNTQTVEFKLRSDIEKSRAAYKAVVSALVTHHFEIDNKSAAAVSLLPVAGVLNKVLTHAEFPLVVANVPRDPLAQAMYRTFNAKVAMMSALSDIADALPLATAPNVVETTVLAAIPLPGDLRTKVNDEINLARAGAANATDVVTNITTKLAGAAGMDITVLTIAESYADEDNKLNAPASVAALVPDPPGFPAAIATELNQILLQAKQTLHTAAAAPGATKDTIADALDFLAVAAKEYTFIASLVASGTAGQTIGLFNNLLNGATTYESVFDQSLQQNFGNYKTYVTKAGQDLMILPPSSAVAGVYASVDSNRGVWKAPANTSLSSVLGPYFLISTQDQESLNIDTNSGKSINAIRYFTGRGTLVWGTRTLAGNDNEWRYVPVRRFFNYAEESIKKATEPFVFEPNDINTWVRVKAMTENFLTLEWRRGALAGAKPIDAFYVKVGLGETMTALDILEGRMIIEIGLAVVRPAEFIILRFSHKMQES
jgi:phage tail sheath protein FI